LTITSPSVVSSSKHYRLQDIQLCPPRACGASADKPRGRSLRHALSQDARLHAMPLGMLGPQTCALETVHAVQGSASGFPVPAANKFPGGHRGGVTPVPIPNTEVKPSTADGTAGAGLWESRSLPGIYRSPTRRLDASGFFFCRCRVTLLRSSRAHEATATAASSPHRPPPTARSGP
jgi:hypothetical protein